MSELTEWGKALLSEKPGTAVAISDFERIVGIQTWSHALFRVDVRKISLTTRVR